MPARDSKNVFKLIIGITGTTGVIYGIRLLETVAKMEDVETHLVISENGELNIRNETNWNIRDVKKLAKYTYGIDEIGARIASGSFRCNAMVVAPCSMKTLGALANSYSSNLLIRAGDVMLKERKPLILLARETPLHLGHLRNMVAITEAGAIIMPPVPAFYGKPKTIDDIVNHTVGRIMDILGLEHHLFTRWEGLSEEGK